MWPFKRKHTKPSDFGQEIAALALAAHLQIDEDSQRLFDTLMAAFHTYPTKRTGGASTRVTTDAPIPSCQQSASPQSSSSGSINES
jgi:hypothetical protein